MAEFVHDVAALDPADAARFGGKGTGLARMHALGLPVPPAFVIDTEACRSAGAAGGKLPPELGDQVTAAIGALEKEVARRFAAPAGTPLLLSVRSGAKVSMPGMMDTILNLGLDARSVLRLAEAATPGFAVDCWLRFWAMYADIVLDVDPEYLRQRVQAERAAAAAELTEQSAGALQAAILAHLAAEGVEAPRDPREQLDAAIRAVFRSWDSRRARTYREHHGIPHDLGTAVVVQVMVFGNLGADSGSGVAFTRDPKSGTAELYGEYLQAGQGEEVVAGTRTPVDLADPRSQWAGLRAELEAHGRTLEREYRDALDIEFTVEGGKLYLLQVRPAKRTATAAVRIACELLADGTIDAAAALRQVTAEQVRRLISPQFDAAAVAAAAERGDLLVTGIGASPGHGSGAAVLDADRAATLAGAGADVVLVRPTTSPQDLRGMLAATAVLTARGGATSHAAVVSRALDKPCVVGAKAIEVRPEEKLFVIGGREFPEGTELSVDGGTGEVFAGLLPRSVPERNADALAGLLTVADEQSQATVWLPVTSAETIIEATRRGAAGIGVLGLTDLLAARPGAVGRLVAAIEALSTAADAPARQVEELLDTDVQEAVRSILSASRGAPVDIRLPVMTSPRARRLIHEWASLAPHLLLPLGPRRILVAYLRAIAAAAAQTGHQATTVLIGGVTHPGEIDAFAELVAEHGGGLRSGAVLANPAVLFAADSLPRADRTLWVDLHELTRAAHGYPEELLFTITELTASGAVGQAAPGEALNPVVAHLLAEVVRAGRGRGRIGLDLSGAAQVGVAPDLYRLGFRAFTSTAATAEELRLVLGQAAAGDGELG